MTATIWPARWPDDLARLARLDTSFTTDFVYRVLRSDLGFALLEERVDPPMRKDYGRVTDDPRLGELEWALVAERDTEAAGFIGAEYEAWNRRAVVRHLYVAPPRRGEGIGRALIDALAVLARATGARCLWVETQNVNVPAVGFYQAAGFRLCGLDESLYDPEDGGGGEVALFFARGL